ncbi:MAG: hypothetical protein AAFX04_09495 [Pseudomonadota bacterium]
MTDNDNEKGPDNKEGWSTGAMVGAAVGSAALMAALLYAGNSALRRKAGAKADAKKGDEMPPPPEGEQYESD